MGKMSELMLKTLAETNDEIRKYALQTWEDLGLTYSEIMILAIINESERVKEPIHKSQIAKRLGLTKSAVTQFCNKLRKKGYIEDFATDGNMKNHYLKLDDSVRESVDSRCYNMNVAMQNFLDNVGEENVVLLMDILKEFSNTALRLSSHRDANPYNITGLDSAAIKPFDWDD